MISTSSLEIPLVSVVVLTYNSGIQLLETLESVKRQTYEKIELIITDDCSKDNTQKVAENWISENSGRFVRTELISVKANTGVAANCNRGVNAAKGNWIKLIAGDDLLLNDCIESNLKHAQKHPEVNVLLSKIIYFSDEGESYSFSHLPMSRELKEFFMNDSKKQFLYFLKGTGLWSVSIFLKKDVYSIVGGYDERRNYLEDYPYYLKLTYNNQKIYLLDRYTVAYRIQSQSLSSRGKSVKIYDTQLWNTAIEYSLKSYRVKYLLNAFWNLMFIKLTQLFISNKRVCNLLYRIRTKWSL